VEVKLVFCEKEVEWVIGWKLSADEFVSEGSYKLILEWLRGKLN